MNLCTVFGKTPAAAAAVLLLFATGCAPKLYTSIRTTLPPRPANAEVLVFDQSDTLPAATTVLGGVLIKNAPGAARCAYDEAMQLAKNATNKAGGNGLHITWHELPATPRQGHQLSAEVLSLHDSVFRAAFEPNIAQQRARMALHAPRIPYRGAQSEYRNTFFLNAGYAFIVSQFITPPDIEGDLSRGLDINAGYQFTHRGFGAGLRYAGYYSSAKQSGDQIRMRLHYIAPEFVLRHALSERWSMNESLGIGYVRYRESLAIGTGKVGGLGYHLNLGIEYKIARGLGINVGAGIYSARFSKMDEAVDQFAPDKKAGITRISLHGGLRCYF